MEVAQEMAAASGSLPYVSLDQDWLDFSGQDSGTLQLAFSPAVWQRDLVLVVDIYSANNPVHPEGHVGWWGSPLWNKGDQAATITRTANGFEVALDGKEPADSWVNPEFSGLEEGALTVKIVLRDATTGAIVFEDAVILHNHAASLQAAEAACEAVHRSESPITSAAWFGWPKDTTVHLAAANIFSRDAIGNFVIDMHRMFRANGVRSQLYASQFEPQLRGAIRHVSNLTHEVSEHDVVLLNFSIYDPYVQMISELPCRKILFFQNVTPPRFFQIYDAELADFCARAYEQLTTLPRFDGYLANSLPTKRVLLKCLNNTPANMTNEAESALLDDTGADASDKVSEPIYDVAVCPPFIDSDKWAGIDSEPIELPQQATRLLYVGRIAPHKRVEDLMALFNEYAKLDEDSALLIVGGGALKGYSNYLNYLLENACADVADRIHMLDHISDGQLKTVYESSSAFVTMTEHEGFCVPLIEAMNFDLPIFAYAEEGVSQTLGRAGRQYFTKDFEPMAEDMHRVLNTDWMRDSIITRQRSRLARWRREADGSVLWSALERVIANGVEGH